MKGLILYIGLPVGLLCTALVMYLFIVRQTQPVIGCYALDNNIRPRSRCILNPLRYNSAEEKPEEILSKLRYGQTQVLVPLFQHLERDNMDHILENESKYQIRSWRIGEWKDNEREFALMYWVERENYDWEEEVRFYFVRESDDWKLVWYSAIY